MRAARATWIYTTGVTLGYIARTSASLSRASDELEKAEMLDSNVLDKDGSNIAQKVIVTVLMSASIPDMIAEALHQDINEDTPSRHKISVVTVTSKSAVVISHPKITEAPSLLKRKLGSTNWDLIHEDIQGRKRDASVCPADYNLCPENVGGGCCPTDRVCGKESCLPASTAPASACGKLGYTACALAEGGNAYISYGLIPQLTELQADAVPGIISVVKQDAVPLQA
jgi:hypothetical protein